MVDEPVPAGLALFLQRKLERTPVAGLAAELRELGINNATIDGSVSLRSGDWLVGTARRLRFLLKREDMSESHGGGYNAQKRGSTPSGRARCSSSRLKENGVR